jgi:hypothetical protein
MSTTYGRYKMAKDLNGINETYVTIFIYSPAPTLLLVPPNQILPDDSSHWMTVAFALAAAGRFLCDLPKAVITFN